MFRVRIFVAAACCVTLHCSSDATYGQQQTVLDVGSQSQLFVDQQAVYEARGISFTPHAARKHPANPLVTADQPWEGWYVTAFGGTVLFDPTEKQFKMWYRAPGNPEYFEHGGICYAVSRDGLHWEKPHVGTIEVRNGKPHNVVSPWLSPSVFLDADEQEPTRRYKMVCFDKNRGYMTQYSADGLHWTEGRVPFLPISYVDDVISAFRDRRTGQFVALPKMSTPVFGRLRRSIYSSTSFDFEHWSKIEPALFADRRDDLGSLARIERARPVLNYPDNENVIRTEFYGSGAYAAESCVIGFPWVFTISTNVPGKRNQEGPIEVQLAVTRDLERWERPFRTPVIAPGGPNEWDCGMILTASQALDVGDEVWMYYGGTNYTHGAPILYGDRLDERGTTYTGSIGLAVWQRDRFVSADASSDGGTLTTVPLKFSGDYLEINGRTQPGGEIRVELVDAGGRALADFEPSVSLNGDELRHRVVFGGQGDLRSLQGRTVCLRFHLRTAELFAFAFRDAAE